MKKNTFRKFIKKNSARITAVLLVAGAICAGVMQNNIANSEAMNIGTGGKSPLVTGSRGEENVLYIRKDLPFLLHRKYTILPMLTRRILQGTGIMPRR